MTVRHTGNRPRRGTRWCRHSATGDESCSVRKTDGLVKAEDSNVSCRADRSGVGRGKPSLGGILDQEEMPLIAPATPMKHPLWKPEVMDQEQRSRALTPESLKLGFDGLESVVRSVEAARKAQLGEGLDLGAMVVRRGENFVSWLQPEGSSAVPECMSPECKQLARFFLERKRQWSAAATVYARRKRWPDTEPRSRTLPLPGFGRRSACAEDTLRGRR